LAKTARFSFANALSGIPKMQSRHVENAESISSTCPRSPNIFVAQSVRLEPPLGGEGRGIQKGTSKAKEIMRRKYEKDQKAQGYKKITHYRKHGKKED